MDPSEPPLPSPQDQPPESGSYPRKRRRKYIAKACNECKRRKIKCNGQAPCHRCGRQRIACIYADNPRETVAEPPYGPPSSYPATTHADRTRPRTLSHLLDRMTAMQEQIASLSAAVYALTRSAASPRQDPAPPARPFRRLSTAKDLPFQGPTTSAFSFDLAKSSLQQRGIVGRTEPDSETRELSPSPSPPGSPSPSPALDGPDVQARGDPLWTIGKSEALRLCRVYEEEMGIMYPVLELGQLLAQVEALYGSMERCSWPRARRGPSGSGLDGTDDVHILRLVFACALTAEASGRSELAMRLFESVRDVADNCVWGVPEISSIIFLTLVAIFYFQMDEETLAWRTIGLVERMCLEKGLHRRATLNHPSVVAAGRDRVLCLFWSIYTLDMRWSFGTGMPFSLEDSDIDPWLPEPEEKTPYLRVMIRYSRIAARVWKFIAAFNNTGEIRKDEMNYLDWQVLQWAAAIPESLRLGSNTSTSTSTSTRATGDAPEPRSLRRLRSLLALRGNQLRMLIHRPVLHSATHIVRYPAECQTVVDLAQDTIRFITRLNETSDIYQLQQVAFNWFLVSALAVLFLAVAQTPARFAARCREEFYLALKLVKGFSTQSYISRRLWKSIRGLRELGPQVGLQCRRPGEDEVEVEDGRQTGVQQPVTAEAAAAAAAASTHSHTPQDGAQMTQELMQWFEAVGALETQIMGVGAQVDVASGYVHIPMLDYGGDLSSVMRDLF
ncbi:putative C6 transcription factor [Aspergillus clavatus NRRL 1]|uniref:Fungal specific transcription factor domain protein n=1 Tax=Aspergillus clavatus (strain ATCC 1007 / CBS 513.65 / DSM 816 / NCTC 3887 / NRRL 1 / QM 1276 / 107) TaxID=344612 RepID=A1C5I0_ASPCL|nr:fungal specific transcription factor domain protein [Aspergillus clavatus NRRL 1]EAW14948.1 fungal specific transcription factor domain protein [Aspergillus clavatus NRRL 1]